MRECGRSELGVKIRRVVNQLELETPRQTEQHRDGGHEADDRPRPGCPSTSAALQRVTDGDVAIARQQDDQPVVHQAHAVRQRIEPARTAPPTTN